MSFAASFPYTPILRKKREPLTPEQARYILNNPYPTGYTYANSSSYSINKPQDYIHPNLGRRPLLSNSSSDSVSYHSYSEDRSYVSQIFYFFYSIIVSIFSFVKTVLVWIFSRVWAWAMIFTPFYPVYLAYQKGSDIFSFIPIIGHSVKQFFVISYRCIEDLITKNGYMLNHLQHDVRSLFWSLLGYEYTGGHYSNVRIEEIEEDNEPVVDEDEPSIGRRALDSAVYASTSGRYSKRLAGRGVTPPARTSHRTRLSGKSRIISWLLSAAGMVYYVVSGRFLFDNVTTEGEHRGVMTRARQQRLEEEEEEEERHNKNFNWKWALVMLLFFMLTWFLFGPYDKEHHNLSYPERLVYGFKSTVNDITSTSFSLTRWIFTKLATILFWIPSALARAGGSVKDFAHNSNNYVHDAGHEAYDYATKTVHDASHDAYDYAAQKVHDVTLDAYDYLSTVKTVPEIVTNVTTDFTTKAWNILSAPIVHGYNIISYPLLYGWNSTKSVLSHVQSDVQHLEKTVSEGGDVAYGYIGDFLYWIVSKIVYALLWIWYSFVSFLRIPYWVITSTIAWLSRPPTLPIPPKYEPPAYEKESLAILTASDEDLDERIRRIMNVVLNEKKNELKHEFLGVIEHEVAKTNVGTLSKEAQLEQLKNLEEFKKNIEQTLHDRINQFGSTMRTEIYSRFEQQKGDEDFQKMRELHSEVDDLKVQLAAQTGLSSRLRKELSDAINQLTESQNKRYEEYQLRLKNLDTIPQSENYETKFNQWESELDKIRKEVRSIAAVSQEADDLRTSAAKDTESRRIETIINSMFEKERETIRLEKEQLNKVIEERMSGKAEASLPLSQEEITKLVQDSIHKLNLSALVDEVVKYHVKSQISETSEHRSTSTYNEFIENKLRATIFEVLKKVNYDKTGEPDFALESAGGHVLSTRCTENYDHLSRRESIFGIPLWYTSYSPRSVIQRQSQNVNAGECWAIKGSEAYLVIKLARNIDVTAVSYEHLPRELSITGNMESAPKKFKIYSLDSENDPNKFLIGEYTFDDQGEPLQRFEAQRHDPRGTPILEFEVISNYGAPFTCLYRFRVHGNPL